MISPLANIHPKAKIGKNVTIEPFTTITEDVVIGDNTWIGPNVTIMDGARIGENCKIFPGAVISPVSQDLKYNGEYTTTEIGANTTIREYVTIHKGTADRGKTVVGENCLIMAYVHIAHDCLIGNNVIIANATQIAGHVTVEDWAIIEGMCGIQQFVRIGQHAFVTGDSSVRKNVPPYVKAAREPLAYAGVNSVGLRRRGFSLEQILQIEDIYRNLYVKGLNVSNAIRIIEQESPQTAEKDIILKFIEESKKGIIRGPLT
ncbi:MAG TPA: acyl-[acyl-carrier-protein]--UDP-N-acetylglucosamine O-acyltransferase [Flavobacteriales bacterium]|nr:acyl-[acyl-carrier-protein]--UDP-N-acetylglucosamine O-acyltransferase [Flavobacteriales bacterium]|tara:strand:- start:5748 stop:6527 length:780 start_codon:yes stop_codon:yes gene_type:complete